PHDRNARCVVTPLRSHDHELAEPDIVHAACLEEVHAPGLHEPRPDDRPRHDHARVPASAAVYGSRRTKSSSSIRAFTFDYTTSLLQRSIESARSPRSLRRTASASRAVSLAR